MRRYPPGFRVGELAMAGVFADTFQLISDDPDHL